MKTRRKYLLVLVLLVTVVTALLFASIVDPGALKKPIAVASSRAGADGGSMAVELVGADGKRLTIERVGSLDVQRAQQRLYVVNHVLGVPLRRAVEKNSKLEAETRELLTSWLQTALPPAQRDLLKRLDKDALRTTPGDVLVVFDLESWMEERR